MDVIGNFEFRKISFITDVKIIGSKTFSTPKAPRKKLVLGER